MINLQDLMLQIKELQNAVPVKVHLEPRPSSRRRKPLTYGPIGRRRAPSDTCRNEADCDSEMRCHKRDTVR